MFKGLRNRVKQILYNRIGVSFNPHGVPFALGKYLKDLSNITVIDVGAHQGDFTSALDRFCGIRHGVLVELQSAYADRLRQQFLPPRFHVEQAAVSDVAGEINVEINSFDATTSILKMKREMRELSAIDVRVAARAVCPVITLDTILAKTGLSHIDLLKLDVQGAEHLVLRGGTTTLARTAMVWTEISFKQLYENACLYNEVIDLLNAAGFSLFDLESGFRGPQGELLQSDALFIRT